ncbi:MAG TPA: pitrilysin family protein [Candidatus Nitrosotenuis sp.]|nr:pitrilysin family protein [Candidatus Nitrosotenuis sp.]
MNAALRNIQKDVLPNGLTVVSETMEHVRSVSLGIWVRSGSRREPKELCGIAHFLEHMLFKGTTRRSAADIARTMDAVGGMLDAFTAKEMICFEAKVLDQHLPLAFDVMADMVLHPRLDADDIEREKNVVLEELKMDQDNPDYLIHELFTSNFWRGHALGRPVSGTPATVRAFTREKVLRCWREWFSPNNLIVTAAGRVDHAQLVALARDAFGGMGAGDNGESDSVPRAHAPIVTRTKNELEQVHLCLGVPCYPVAHERRYALAVLNTILGGGMSSRLFQNIREQQGLAYAVFSELNPYRDTGLLSVYAGTALETAGRVARMVAAEFRALRESPVSEEELQRAKDNLKGSLLLSLESTSARMGNLGRQEIYFGRFFSLEEILAAVEAVTREELREMAAEFFQPEKICATVLGPLDGFELKREDLEC